MDLRHQSNAMCIIMLGGDGTHPWFAKKVGNPIPATVLVKTQKIQQTTHSSHYHSNQGSEKNKIWKKSCLKRLKHKIFCLKHV